jgi:hypothetical protein
MRFCRGNSCGCPELGKTFFKENTFSKNRTGTIPVSEKSKSQLTKKYQLNKIKGKIYDKNRN